MKKPRSRIEWSKWLIWSTKMADNQHFQYINKRPYSYPCKGHWAWSAKMYGGMSFKIWLLRLLRCMTQVYSFSVVRTIALGKPVFNCYCLCHNSKNRNVVHIGAYTLPIEIFHWMYIGTAVGKEYINYGTCIWACMRIFNYVCAFCYFMGGNV